jgi:hypothetical protein
LLGLPKIVIELGPQQTNHLGSKTILVTDFFDLLDVLEIDWEIESEYTIVSHEEQLIRTIKHGTYDL